MGLHYPTAAEPPALWSFPVLEPLQFPFPLVPPPIPNSYLVAPAPSPAPPTPNPSPPGPQVHLYEDLPPLLQALPLPEVSPISHLSSNAADD